MKAARPVLLALAILLVVAAGACGEDAIETTTTGAEDSTTAALETITTAMPDTTMATNAEGTTTPLTNVTYYTKVTPAEAKELIDTTPDLVIIDTGRTYDQGHLPGALDYTDVLDFGEGFGEGIPDSAVDALDKNVPILIYEGTYGESAMFASQLGSYGFTVYGLVGGLNAWMDAGYPVETPLTNVTYYTKVTAAEAKELIDTTPDLVIIDVGRTYDQGHLPGALDYSDVLVQLEGVPDSVVDTLDKNVPILTYEGTYGDGYTVATQLGSYGFTVYGLVGGLNAWMDAGYPVEQ